MIRELFLDDAPIPVGARVGDLVHGLRLPAPDVSTALAHLRDVVHGAGAELENVAQVSFFVRSPDLLPTINPAWLQVFPDDHDRPTYKFMLDAALTPERPVQVEFFAVAGQRRQMLHVPGVAHVNPIPLGIRIGPYLFSSRVLPYAAASGQPPPDVARQAAHLFANVRALLTQGGLEPGTITQGRLFLADPADLAVVEPLWRDLVAQAGQRAALQVTPYALAPSLRVMLEFIASLSPL